MGSHVHSELGSLPRGVHQQWPRRPLRPALLGRVDDSHLVVGAKWERPLGTVALPLGKVPGVLATTTDPAAPLRLHQDFCESGPQAEMAARVSPEVEYQMAQAAHNESPQRHGDQHEGLGGPNSATKCALKAAPKCGTKSGHTGNVPEPTN